MQDTLTRAELEKQVIDCVTETCDLDCNQVLPSLSLVMDLGIDSIDFVDLIYHLEKRFGISIKMGDFEREARSLAQGPFEKNSVLTPAGIESLKIMMPEVSPEKIKEGMTLAEIPKLFTVASLVGMVERKRKAIAR